MEKEFVISPEIYSGDSLQQAIGDFSEVGTITYKQWIVTLSGESDSEIDEIFREFMNYVLSLSK